MSLDITLVMDSPLIKKTTGIFVRENGVNKELTLEEAIIKYPNSDITEYEIITKVVFEANITHNLNLMAREAGIYEACWRPENINVINAKDIIPVLEKGILEMKATPDRFKKFNPDNGWGCYDDFIVWLERYLNACKKYPESEIVVNR